MKRLEEKLAVSLLNRTTRDKLVLLFDKALLHGEPFGGAVGIYTRIAGGFLPSFGQLAKACWGLLLVCEAHSVDRKSVV